MESIKRSELLHFSKVTSREEVLVLDMERRAEMVENALTLLYKLPEARELEELLSLVQTIVRFDHETSERFKETSYVICNKHLVITYVNKRYLTRSGVEWHEVVGKS